MEPQPDRAARRDLVDGPPGACWRGRPGTSSVSRSAASAAPTTRPSEVTGTCARRPGPGHPYGVPPAAVSPGRSSRSSWSNGEAYLPAQHTAACSQARLPPSHVHPSRPCDHQVASASRSQAPVGLIRLIVRVHGVGRDLWSNASRGARCSVGLLRRPHAIAPDRSRSWSHRVSLTRVTVRVSRWRLGGVSVTPSCATASAARSGLRSPSSIVGDRCGPGGIS